MTKFLLDADSAIYAMVDLHSPVNTRIAECLPGEIAISAISFAEIALGMHLQKPPPPRVLEAFLAAVPILAFDEAAARKYAELPFKRTRFDRLLAAHALAVRAIVVTNNAKDFSDVPRLRVENWNDPL